MPLAGGQFYAALLGVKDEACFSDIIASFQYQAEFAEHRSSLHKFR